MEQPTVEGWVRLSVLKQSLSHMEGLSFEPSIGPSYNDGVAGFSFACKIRLNESTKIPAMAEYKKRLEREPGKIDSGKLTRRSPVKSTVHLIASQGSVAAVS